MRRSLFRAALMGAALLVAMAAMGVRLRAQDTAVLSPNVFLRGVQTAQNVRYTAAFVKPDERAALANVSVEITLPPGVAFLDMFVGPQVQANFVRLSAAGAFTLIWQMAQVPADEPLDVFTFTTAQPLSAELEFYMTWQDGAGARHVENFFEIPTVTLDVQSEGQAALTVPGEYVALGETGVQAAAEAVPLTLTAHLLPADFNPPPEFGPIWWCSLLELSGLPDGATAQVIVPLRRPLAPFTGLALFHQGPDGAWQPLDGAAVVTADGQHVLYTHPGGVVATGGPEAIQPDVVPSAEVPVETPAPVEPSAAPVEVTPIEATAIEATPSAPVETPVTILSDATTSTGGTIVRPAGSLPTRDATLIVIGASSATPPLFSTASPTLGGIADGSSNTILIGEATRTATPAGDGSVRFVTPAPFTTATASSAPGGIADGSSNTIVIGEATRTATLRFVTLAPFATATASPAPGGIADGSSNTILIGEATRTPTPTGDGSVRLLTPAPFTTATFTATPGGIADGSSNTILIGEATRTATPRFVTLAPFTTATFTATPGGIADGSSNTILIGEATRTSTPTGDGSVRLLTPAPFTTATFTAAPFTTATFTATRGGIADGSSNTIVTGPTTSTPTTRLITPAPFTTATFTATRGGIADGSSNTIVTGPTTSTPTPRLITPAPFTTATFTAAPGGIADGSSNTIVTGPTTSTPTPRLITPAPFTTATFTATRGRTATPTPIVVIGSGPSTGGTLVPFGGGGVRVVIIPTGNTLQQCQAGGVNCAVLQRRIGSR